MDWEKAKKTFIYLLIVLNVLLFAANYVIGSKYKLTQREEAAVHQVLSSKGMGIYCNLIEESKPMRYLSVSAAEYNADELMPVYFDENEEIETTLEFEQMVLESKDKRLEIQDSGVKFYCEKGTGKIENFGRQTAKDAAEKFAEKMGAESGKNVLEKIRQSDDSYIFEFEETFSGYKVFSNVKRIEVAEEGVVYAETAYFTVQNFTGEKQEICGCDEALLTVMYQVVAEGNSVGRYVEDVELGYSLLGESENYDPEDIKLVPCYSVYVSGSDEPYRVNACTNEIIK